MISSQSAEDDSLLSQDKQLEDKELEGVGVIFEDLGSVLFSMKFPVQTRIFSLNRFYFKYNYLCENKLCLIALGSYANRVFIYI